MNRKTSNSSSSQPLRLCRSEMDRIVAGIAGGLGEYFQIDPLIIRIIFIVLFLQGSGFFLYLLLWLIIPSCSNLEKTSQETLRENAWEIKGKAEALTSNLRKQVKKQNKQLWLGIFVILLGIWLFLVNFGFFSFFHLEKFWPLLLILLGITILGKNGK